MHRALPALLATSLLVGVVGSGCKKEVTSVADAGATLRPADDAGAGESRSTPAASGESAGGVLAAATSAVPTKLHPRSAAAAGKTIDVPAGVLLAGTSPNDEGRDPGAPAGLSPHLVGAFTIDALPYPNDPAQPPKTGISREEASKACQERGARLCTELEWERACKGPEAEPFATGSGWDPACNTESATCVSGFGARGMGALREWVDGKGEGEEGLPVRGGGPKEPGAGVQRCARKSRGQGTAADLGFRCCKGGEKPKIPEIEPFRKTKLEAKELAEIIAQAPELTKLGADIRLFDPADTNAVTGRTQAPREGLTFSTQPILWSPDTGIEVLVVTGRSKNASFVLALYPLANGKYKTASYFVMLGDVAPVALAYNPGKRRELQWSTCWGCSGESGGVSFREDRRIVIVQF